MSAETAKIREWLERFRSTPLAAAVVAGLEKRASEIWQQTFDTMQRESSEYRNAVDEEFTDESQSHCKDLLHLIVAIAKGRAGRSDTDAFAFVRTHAAWRARHHVPLIASLHAYRLAHKTYGGVTRELLLQHPKRHEALLSLAMLSDFWIEFFDLAGSVLAEAHAVEEGLSVAESTDGYAGLIERLLRGTAPDDGDVDLLARCGIHLGAPMAVAVARPFPSGNGKQSDVEPALRSLVRLIRQELPSANFGKLVTIRNDEVTAIVSSYASPGRSMLRILRRRGSGRRGVGVGRDTKDVAQLPDALHEARLALEFATPAQAVMHFDDILLTEFLIRRADKTALRLVPKWAPQLNSSGGLSQTIRVFVDCSLNVKQTASRLGVHPNTVYFRLNQIRQLTGIDPRTFSGASLLTTALRLVDANMGRLV